jgi:hypothetical protein
LSISPIQIVIKFEGLPRQRNVIEIERQFWNYLVEEYYAVSITENWGYKASLKQIIKSVIDIYAVEKGNDNVPDKWEFKICVDGRKLSDRQTVLAMVTVDTEYVFH